mgnify:FL=1
MKEHNSFFYTSERIGKGGKPFVIYKVRTLKDDGHSQFAEEYTRFGRFLRKTKLDELPQLFNVLKGDIGLFGYRAEEKRTWEFYPKHIQRILARHKPGLIDLSSIHFFSEEKILEFSEDKHRDYWEKIFPIKMALRSFYFENRCISLNLVLGWIVFKKVLKAFFR